MEPEVKRGIQQTIDNSNYTQAPMQFNIIPPRYIAQHRKSLEFRDCLNSGTLKHYLEPRYDTIDLKEENEAQITCKHCCFMIPNGTHGKTLADTNMVIGASLGLPCWAQFTYVRFHFERYHSLEDAVSFKEQAGIQVIMGQSDVHWQGSMGSMNPILPKGGYRKIDRMIKNGTIRMWPWYEAVIGPLLIGPTDIFQVRICFKSGFKPQNDMRIKVVLGPDFYRP